MRLNIAPPAEGGFRLPNASKRERCLSGPCMTERGQEEPGSWGTEPERAAAAYRWPVTPPKVDTLCAFSPSGCSRKPPNASNSERCLSPPYTQQFLPHAVSMLALRKSRKCTLQ